MEYPQIVETLKEIRIKKKISSHDISKTFGKTRQYLYLVEKGELDLKLKDYLTMCKVLNISPCLLLDSENAAFYETAKQLHNLSNRDFLLIKHMISLMENTIETL